MTDRQSRFCNEYLLDLNATQAAIRAGYSERYAHNNAPKLLQNTAIRDTIKAELERLRSENTAETREILEYLTAVMRGELLTEAVVIEGTGKGTTRARTILKKPDMRDRLKAAELLGKYYSLFTQRVQVKADIVQIIDDISETA